MCRDFLTKECDFLCCASGNSETVKAFNPCDKTRTVIRICATCVPVSVDGLCKGGVRLYSLLPCCGTEKWLQSAHNKRVVLMVNKAVQSQLMLSW